MLKFTVYKDKKGEHRWRAKRGGRVVADSGEGYTRKRDAERALRSFHGAICRGEYDSIIDGLSRKTLR